MQVLTIAKPKTAAAGLSGTVFFDAVKRFKNAAQFTFGNAVAAVNYF